MPTSVDTAVTVLPSGLAISSGLNIGERETANPVSPDATGSVNWIRTSDGAVIAEIDAYFPDPIGAPKQHYARWSLTNQDNPDAPFTEVLQEVDTGKYQTRVVAGARAKGSNFTHTPTVIDANGGSDFVQAVSEFGTPQITEMYFGGQVVVMPAVGAGGLVEQTVTDLKMGGRTPAIVLSQMTLGGGIYFSQQWVIGTRSPGVNNFVVTVWNNGAALGANWSMGLWYIALFRAN